MRGCSFMIFKNIFILGFIFIMSNNSKLLAQTTWLVEKSKIQFTIRNAGLNVEGSFSGLEAQINFDPSQLKSSKIEAKILAKTVDTGLRARDRHLRQSDYFGVEQYPYIKMESLGFGKSKEGNFEGSFKLTIKNISKTISLPFSFKREGNLAYLEGGFEINRRDFGVGGWSLILGNEVRVRLSIQVKSKGSE